MKESKVRTNEARKDLKLVMLPKKQNRDRNRKEIERKTNKETIKTGRKKECIVSK